MPPVSSVEKQVISSRYVAAVTVINKDSLIDGHHMASCNHEVMFDI